MKNVPNNKGDGVTKSQPRRDKFEPARMLTEPLELLQDGDTKERMMLHKAVGFLPEGEHYNRLHYCRLFR